MFLIKYCNIMCVVSGLFDWLNYFEVFYGCFVGESVVFVNCNIVIVFSS